jgi:bifunctional UDP-N-acetylglucosamine pyrophosphorylase/glucosamine-1-phosphate N-acetyltransferase
MIPVANRPLISYAIEALERLSFERIIVAAGRGSEQIRNHFAQDGRVKVVEVSASKSDKDIRGTAASLIQAVDSEVESLDEEFLVLYADTIADERDLARLANSSESDPAPRALVYALGAESSRDWICCSIENGAVKSIAGHPRGGYGYRFAAFSLNRAFLPYLRSNSGLFTEVQVGVMPPREAYLEMSLSDFLKAGKTIPVVKGEGLLIDVDKPWHILAANRSLNRSIVGAQKKDTIAEGASIDPSASISGHVRLGRGSRIGRNVVVEGNIAVGEGTTIENGALLGGNNTIGNDCYIGNSCLVGKDTTIGNKCNINHCAEVEGVVMDRVYLYHYMEVCGVVGENTDLGAGTVCGTLRFDDGVTTHRVKGRAETPQEFGNAAYLGDYCRTGVNAVLMPGRKVGAYSVVGAGVILNEDLSDRTMLYVQQKLQKKDWGPERYGW